MEREIRSGIPAEIRAEGDGIRVTGYAAVFGQRTENFAADLAVGSHDHPFDQFDRQAPGANPIGRFNVKHAVVAAQLCAFEVDVERAQWIRQ